MDLNNWMRINLPEKDKISRDAVEILIKMAWEEAVKSERLRVERKGPQGPYDLE